MTKYRVFACDLDETLLNDDHLIPQENIAAIRRFLPKGTDFRKVTVTYIQRVEDWINNYPREILGFETSGDLFDRQFAPA